MIVEFSRICATADRTLELDRILESLALQTFPRPERRRPASARHSPVLVLVGTAEARIFAGDGTDAALRRMIEAGRIGDGEMNTLFQNAQCLVSNGRRCLGRHALPPLCQEAFDGIEQLAYRRGKMKSDYVVNRPQ
jgi:hypothetical protein